MSLVVNSAARISSVFSSIPMWILRQTRRFVPPCLRAFQALDMAILKFRREGADVEVIGMNAASETLVDKLAIHDKPGAMEKLMGH